MTTIQKIEAYLKTDIPTAEEPAVQQFIAAVTAYIERYTGRKFSADETASPRLYDGNNDDV